MEDIISSVVLRRSVMIGPDDDSSSSDDDIVENQSDDECQYDQSDTTSYITVLHVEDMEQLKVDEELVEDEEMQKVIDSKETKETNAHLLSIVLSEVLEDIETTVNEVLDYEQKEDIKSTLFLEHSPSQTPSLVHQTLKTSHENLPTSEELLELQHNDVISSSEVEIQLDLSDSKVIDKSCDDLVNATNEEELIHLTKKV